MLEPSVGGQILAKSVCTLPTWCSNLCESPAFWVEDSLWSLAATEELLRDLFPSVTTDNHRAKCSSFL